MSEMKRNEKERMREKIRSRAEVIRAEEVEVRNNRHRQQMMYKQMLDEQQMQYAVTGAKGSKSANYRGVETGYQTDGQQQYQRVVNSLVK